MGRESKRAFKKASKGFNPPVTGEWGYWEEKDIHAQGSPPLPGMYRFCVNEKYSVQFYREPSEHGDLIRLLIRHHTGKPVRSWHDFQRIKNELVGEETIAVEVYPKESALVDQANCYHLWVIPPDFPFPFNLEP
jgi:hypothetical protein